MKEMLNLRVEQLTGALILLLVMAGPLRAASDDAALAKAMKAGDKTAVQALLKQGADVNGRQSDGATALHWAAYWDDRDSADLLIRAGATVDARNDLGVTPLWVACTGASVATMARLLEAGADANATPPTGATPLMTAARTGSAEAVRALLSHGANVNAKERREGQSALMWAVAQQHPEVVGALLERGADVHARSIVFRQRVLLCCEAYLGDAEGLAEIDMGGFTPLLFAARYGDVDSASLLLRAGANVNDLTPDGTSVLMVAALSGHRPLATFLLSKGADPNVGAAGYTALHAAVLRNDLELVKVLLANGANPNVPLTKATLARIGGGAETDWAFDKAWKGGTPFWLAARFGAVDILHVLSANGADWRMAANDGSTPLTVAAQQENAPRMRSAREERERRTLDALKFVIGLGADVNGTDEAGNAPLHVAASKRLVAVIQFLVDNGAVLDRKDRNGQTPLAIAMTPPPPPRGIFVAATLRKDDNRGTIDLLRKLGARE